MSKKSDGLQEFISALDKAANGGFAKQLGLWLEGMGMDFLDIVQDEIVKTETVDTRRLFNSFGRGDSDNIWSISNGGLTIEIGTNLTYADIANDGHFQNRRWVPGRWMSAGDDQRFEYDPSATTGMMLKEKWVDGTGYWDNALAIFDRTFENALDRKLQEWLDSNF